jgi:hypothetical protein
MDFAGGSKKQFALTEVHDSGAKSLFALSLYNKHDASPIVNVIGKDKTGAVPTVKDPTIRDIFDGKNFSMVGLSKRV